MDSQVEQIEPKPCPFCGGTPYPHTQNGLIELSNRAWRQHVWCLDCDVTGPERDTSAQAIEAWNTRASLALPKVESETIERQTALSDLEVLVSACEAEFTSEGTEIDPDDDPDGIGGFPDDFSVSDGLADDGQTIVPGQITFGHIRRARAALATLNTGGTHG